MPIGLWTKSHRLRPTDPCIIPYISPADFSETHFSTQHRTLRKCPMTPSIKGPKSWWKTGTHPTTKQKGKKMLQPACHAAEMCLAGKKMFFLLLIVGSPFANWHKKVLRKPHRTNFDPFQYQLSFDFRKVVCREWKWHLLVKNNLKDNPKEMLLWKWSWNPRDGPYVQMSGSIKHQEINEMERNASGENQNVWQMFSRHHKAKIPASESSNDSQGTWKRKCFVEGFFIPCH